MGTTSRDHASSPTRRAPQCDSCSRRFGTVPSRRHGSTRIARAGHNSTAVGVRTHRSPVAADAESGDGAGMLVQIPHAFLWRACRSLGISLPEIGTYGVGMMFLPPNGDRRLDAERRIERLVAERGCRVLGWRDVPVDERYVGVSARATRPAIRQLFLSPLGVNLDVDDASAFERALY